MILWPACKGAAVRMYNSLYYSSIYKQIGIADKLNQRITRSIHYIGINIPATIPEFSFSWDVYFIKIILCRSDFHVPKMLNFFKPRQAV
jgi:hypothetical protein